MPQPRARHPRHKRHEQHRCHAQAPPSQAQRSELSTLQQLRLADVKLRTRTQPLGQAAAAARRDSHLAQAVRLCNSSTQAACRRRRANIAAEFSEEMQLLGGSIAKANDEDMAGFFAGVHTRSHMILLSAVQQRFQTLRDLIVVLSHVTLSWVSKIQRGFWTRIQDTGPVSNWYRIHHAYIAHKGWPVVHWNRILDGQFRTGTASFTHILLARDGQWCTGTASWMANFELVPHPSYILCLQGMASAALESHPGWPVSNWYRIHHAYVARTWNSMIFQVLTLRML